MSKLLSIFAAAAAAAIVTACASGPDGSAGANDIAGTVTGAKGPEAGVWVIAETNDLPTKFAKVVVTDDNGRFLVPDLPKANYSVWVRGYGLVDSDKVQSTPGSTLALKAVAAPSDAAAAEFYPGMYWYSMLQIPPVSDFPGTGEKGNGIPAVMKTQAYWVDTIKNSCQSCHALGSKGVRTVPPEFGHGIDRLGPPHAVRAGDDQHGADARTHRPREGRCNCSATGPTASPPASCPRRSRRVRRAWSATW